jgi:hypothetical protein
MSLFLLAGAASSDEKKDMQGWGLDDPYNKLYDVREYEKIRAWVVRLREAPPMPGMSPATIVDVREGSEEFTDVFEVHMCPTWFAKPSEIGIKPGDRIKIKGAWAEIDGKDVFMASKIVIDPLFEFKVRMTSNGMPFWLMSQEEVERERALSAEERRKEVGMMGN